MTASTLYFDLRLDYATRRISVGGELDAATAPCLRRVIVGFQQAASGDITIRLDDVTFLDMAGLGALAHASAAQTDRGDQLRVTGARDSVRRVLERAQRADLLDPVPARPVDGDRAPSWAKIV
jgi:anti-anti-sigma factor